MNAIVQQQAPQLPAHLRDFGTAASIGLSAIGGISTGGQSHPRISIKQNRFRLLDSQDQEFLVQALHLDIIVVGANDFVSKQYYASAFDPAAGDAVAPTCFSDNGVGPSERSTAPQASLCSGCPHNAWGSKITPSGTKIKACSDSKKLAVLLADNPTGLVYELRVPAASMENLKSFIDTYVKPEMPLPGYVLRMTFDDKSSYPKLLFQPAAYITPQQKAAIMDVLGGDEVAEAVGKKDKARDPNQQAIAAPVATPVPVPQIQAAQSPVPQFQPPTSAQSAAAPAPQYFAPPAPSPYAPPVPQGLGPLPQPVAEPVKRTRRTKAQIAADTQQGVPDTAQYDNFQQADQHQHPAPSPYAPPVPQFQAPPGFPPEAAPHPIPPQFVAAQPVAPLPQHPDYVPPAAMQQQHPAPTQFDVPHAQAPAASVALQPPVTDNALDAMLGQAMMRG